VPKLGVDGGFMAISVYGINGRIFTFGENAVADMVKPMKLLPTGSYHIVHTSANLVCKIKS
jgi:hypothetical protein